MRPDPEYNEEGQAEWEVAQILELRKFRNRKEYLIKWKDYPIHEATWEPLKNLKGTAEEIIKEYENEIKKK